MKQPRLRTVLFAIGAAFVMLPPLAAAVFRRERIGADPSIGRADYVGDEVCAQCHQAEDHRWDGSPHDLAMRPATLAAVNVSCETCHGPGARHVAWAKREGPWQRVDTATKALASITRSRAGRGMRAMPQPAHTVQRRPLPIW